ncbi:MAG: NeuD/PglB/VioB family sugar acetyltransferase [Parvibaculum sp.]|uniref:NeuD/PglB/VioB family sugar acetyltransferase n=1 Tax=Parvibaculum sp. TaxID=2024848 RepID=UPI0025F2F148|nr:NeuD/PglB/VioB family sugar acetyltransferase [Parvibaculum sp.]MCE9649657.1 NeuD/PglB/VioB family sugar acetyltransferase [Parvibaculum sp.]
MSGSALYIIGGGGHAKVAIAAAEAAGLGIAAIYDDNQEKRGTDLIGYRIGGAIPPADWWRSADGGALIAIGDNRARQRIAAQCPARWQALIHPSAWVHASAKIGPGALICAGAIVQPDAVIGAHAIVNTGAVVEHDCIAGDFVHLGPASCLAGGASVAEGAFLGAGAVIIPGISVGAWAIVGAGAAVTATVADNTKIAGVPAKPLA